MRRPLLLAAASLAATLAAPPGAPAQEKKSGVFKFESVMVHRAYINFAKEDKVVTPTKDEELKTNPGKFEIEAGSDWFHGKFVLTVNNVPDVVREGQAVTISATLDGTVDLKPGEPVNGSTSVSAELRLMRQNDLKEIAGSATNPFKAGKHTLKASKSATMVVNTESQFYISTYKGVRYAQFKAHSYSGTGNPNRQFILETTWTYREDPTAKPGPMPPVPNPNPMPPNPMPPGPGPGPNPHPEPGPLPPLPDNVRREIDGIQAVLRTRGEPYTVGHTGVSHLTLAELCGFRVPQGIDLGAYAQFVNQRGRQWIDTDIVRRTEFERKHPNVLPEVKVEPRVKQPEYVQKSRFNWRDYNKVTPVTYQGKCGSCWDFAAMGAFECSYLIRNDVTIRGSEQQALDCVKKGNCIGGWHMDVFDFLAGHGGCPESAYPYTATKNDTCKPVTSPYRAVSWAFVAPDGKQPTVDAMKAALVKHGPVACVLHATAGFHHYTGGVFDEHDNNLSKDTHVVLIVGWDDSKGKGGAWAIRNSWGTKWGEQGFGWVSYGSNGIGDHAAWVEAESNRYQTMTLMTEQYRVKQGTRVYAPVHLLNPTDLNDLDWVVHYDGAVAKLEEPKVSNGNVPLYAFRVNAFQPNRVLLGFAEETSIKTGGQVARLHFQAVGAPGTKSPLTLELKWAHDPQGKDLPTRLVHGSIEVIRDDDTGRLKGSCCGLDRLVIQDVYCALEMSVELRPSDPIMDMDGNGVVNARDAALIIRRLSAAARTGQ